jgi:hypothetical protein
MRIYRRDYRNESDDAHDGDGEPAANKGQRQGQPARNASTGTGHRGR